MADAGVPSELPATPKTVEDVLRESRAPRRRPLELEAIALELNRKIAEREAATEAPGE